MTVHVRRWVAARCVCSGPPPQTSTRCVPGSRSVHLLMSVGVRCVQLPFPPANASTIDTFLRPGPQPCPSPMACGRPASVSTIELLLRCRPPTSDPASTSTISFPTGIATFRVKGRNGLVNAEQWHVKWYHGSAHGLNDSTSEKHSNRWVASAVSKLWFSHGAPQGGELRLDTAVEA